MDPVNDSKFVQFTYSTVKLPIHEVINALFPNQVTVSSSPEVVNCCLNNEVALVTLHKPEELLWSQYINSSGATDVSKVCKQLVLVNSELDFGLLREDRMVKETVEQSVLERGNIMYAILIASGVGKIVDSRLQYD